MIYRVRIVTRRTTYEVGIWYSLRLPSRFIVRRHSEVGLVEIAIPFQ